MNKKKDEKYQYGNEPLTFKMRYEQKRYEEDKKRFDSFKSMEREQLQIKYSKLKSQYDYRNKLLSLIISVVAIALVYFLCASAYSLISRWLLIQGKINLIQSKEANMTTIILLGLIFIVLCIVVALLYTYFRKQRIRKQDLIMIEEVLSGKKRSKK